ncbi:MAG: energy transducer TonB [Vampirovibrionales bacterium]
MLPPSPMAPTIRTPSGSSAANGPIMPSPSSSASRSGSNYSAPSQIAGSPSRATSGRSGSYGSPGSAGGSGGTGRENSFGSPGGGGGRPGIDALPEPDYGSYMAELQRRIKRNWQPPRAQEDKRVVAFFRIGRDGRLLSVSIKQSSGYSEADQAAINAVRLSSPFRPLPVGHSEADLPVEFTFDYNVYRATRL